MGLLKAGFGALGGVLADQWKEYFYCDALPANVLAVKGSKRTSGRSSTTKGSEIIISSGSVIAVNEGQCMRIVGQGKVVEVCAEPGEFIYDASTEPTVFAGLWARASCLLSRILASASPSAVKLPRIREFTISTSKS